LLLLVAWCSLGAAWGPVSHVVFAQSGLQAFDASAVDAPDGYFGFMGAQFSYGSYAGACPVEEKLHNPVIAGALVQKALRAPTPDAQYVLFLLSYQSHMLGDLVGFFPGGGYLTRTVDASVNWVTLWPKMQTIDAYLLQQYGLASLVIPYLNATHNRWFSRDIASVANLSYSPAVLEECGNGWIDVQNRLIQYYRTLRDVAPQLAFFDTRGSNVTVAQTLEYLRKNVNCAGAAVAAYTKEILAMTDPKVAFAAVSAQVAQWYADDECT
jgi:hypothetical protein